MLIHKMWQERYMGGLKIRYCEGWYLFGLIPLYVRKIET